VEAVADVVEISGGPAGAWPHSPRRGPVEHQHPVRATGRAAAGGIEQRLAPTGDFADPRWAHRTLDMAWEQLQSMSTQNTNVRAVARRPTILITATSDADIEQQTAALGIRVLKKPSAEQVLHGAIRQELDQPTP
jgi:hypothetical protein